MRRLTANRGWQLLCGGYASFPLRSPNVRWQGTQQSSLNEAKDSTSTGKNSANTFPMHGEGASADEASGTPKSRIHPAAVRSTMERAASARRDINDLWRITSEQEISLDNLVAEERKEGTKDQSRIAAVRRILDEYQISITTPRDEDICQGLGEAFDRLLLLCVPFSTQTGTEELEQVLQAGGRQGRKLSIRTVQHLFSRANSYAEALAIFYSLRRCHFAMNMETYHAMLYSLQRLEEEGWAMRFHDEYVQSKGESLSEEALDFVLCGINNQLLPENKPWLGRIMFSEVNNAATQRQTHESFDELGKLWLNRYKNA